MKGTAILMTGLAVLLLQGCVSMQNFSEYAKRLPPPMQGEGHIWFYRESRFVGGGIQPSVLLNGKKIGKARPGGYFYVDRPAGNDIVTCETGQINECRLVLAPQSTKYIRLSMGLEFTISFGNIIPSE